MDAEPLQTDLPEGAPPKRKRRWFQFSLRSLLIFTIVVAIACGWLGKRIERARQQMQSVSSIHSLNGEAKYEFELAGNAPTGAKSWLSSVFGIDFADPVVEVSFGGDTRDANLALLADLPTIKRLNLYDTEVTDKGLAFLPQLRQLESLDISNTRITDAGLKQVAQLRSLRSLSLRNDSTTYGGNHPQSSQDYSVVSFSVSSNVVISPGTIITGNQAAPVISRGARGYDWYCVHEPQIGDAGLEHLAQLLNLESLDLEGTDVTGEGIARLKGLPNLTYLSVRGTNVSEAAIAELKLALPRLAVVKLFPPKARAESTAKHSFAPWTPDILIDFGIPGQSKRKSFNAP